MANKIQKLTQQINDALYLWESITLKDLVDFYPVTGLAEIYTYLKIAYDSPVHDVTCAEDTLTIDGNRPATKQKITMPMVTFYRQEAKTTNSPKQSPFSKLLQFKIENITVAA